jgi:hypothetical protein
MAERLDGKLNNFEGAVGLGHRVNGIIEGLREEQAAECSARLFSFVPTHGE